MYGTEILFLLKRNQNYSSYSKVKASGLFNSAVFVSEALQSIGYETQLEICIDGNSIDKFLHQYKPKICIIEALWVTPEKIKELVALHPKVHFVIRVHSNIPFLSNEGIAIQWIKEYSAIENVKFSFNNQSTTNDFKAIGIDGLYLPNIYLKNNHCSSNTFKKLAAYHLLKHLPCPRLSNKGILSIGLFGAIRPLKNHLIQAMAAISYADANNKILHLHINSTRVEQKGDSALKNLRALFENSKHKLVEHLWISHKDFLEIIKTMDLGMQVSLSESFNIVTADFVSQNIPIIVSEEISWMPSITKVKSATSVKSIKNKIDEGMRFRQLFADLSVQKLENFNVQSLRIWNSYLTRLIFKK